MLMSFLGASSVVLDSLLVVTPIEEFCNCSMFCCVLRSGFANILMGKRERVALLSLCSRCLVIFVWLFLTLPWLRLQSVGVVLPDNNLQHRFNCLMNDTGNLIIVVFYHWIMLCKFYY